eukprot:gnl/TRDRNA2_/TRDRNA2_161738_c3_seq1.p1 gnl/TRDRNA2_/TRDRNA2_161738_c3~~gnl/TRDRNA2_/TRDRNA2_161738_c3_seq1.p1  ORF type:complete len:459 (-),score=56.30 gnl/TRDRNA2_/TRDRNA2_161738_c3_seq1:12-1388(-)
MGASDAAAHDEAPVHQRLLRHRCVLEAPEPVSVGGNNFAKAAEWSPDGAVILAAHDDSWLRLYAADSSTFAQSETPDMKDGEGAAGATQEPTTMEPYACVIDGGPILDFAFFPGFNWSRPEICCFISCSQDHPIHLRDAFSGALRNTYRPYNHVDEVCHAFSLCFSFDGCQILGGFSQYIRVFDVQRPGRQVEDWHLSTRKGSGQKGIIGAIAGSPYRPGWYAAGSYNRNACIYAPGSKGKYAAKLSDDEHGYEMGGVTRVVWAGENLLLTGHRCDRWLRAWDLRMIGDTSPDHSSQPPRALLHRFPRPVRTHQRFVFSVQGELLAAGDDEGTVSFYSLTSLQELGRLEGAHKRPCVSSILHPQRSDVLLSASGSRAFPDYDVDSAGEEVPDPSPSPHGRKRSASVMSNAEETKADGAFSSTASTGTCGRQRRESADVQSRKSFDNSVRVWRLSWASA